MHPWRHARHLGESLSKSVGLLWDQMGVLDFSTPQLNKMMSFQMDQFALKMSEAGSLYSGWEEGVVPQSEFWLGKDYPWMRGSYPWMRMVTFWPGLFGDALTHVTRQPSPDAHNCWIWKSLLNAAQPSDQGRALWCCGCPNILTPHCIILAQPSKSGMSGLPVWGFYNVGRSSFSKKPITSLCWSCKLWSSISAHAKNNAAQIITMFLTSSTLPGSVHFTENVSGETRWSKFYINASCLNFNCEKYNAPNHIQMCRIYP